MSGGSGEVEGRRVVEWVGSRGVSESRSRSGGGDVTVKSRLEKQNRNGYRQRNSKDPITHLTLSYHANPTRVLGLVVPTAFMRENLLALFLLSYGVHAPPASVTICNLRT
jgi:hypothetical protein